MSKTKLGKNLRTGDTLKVWWSSNTRKPNEDTIIELEEVSKNHPNGARMSHVFKQGYCFARFLSGVSMTIDFGEYYELA